MLIAQLKSDRPYVVAWAIQLLCEKSDPPSEVVKEFARLANESLSPVVRLYLSSACQRMPLEERWDIIVGLLGHAEDANDHNLPLMDWYALEAAVRRRCTAGRSRWRPTPGFRGCWRSRCIASAARAGRRRTRWSRRWGRMEDDARRLEILNGIRDSLQGRRSVPMAAGVDGDRAEARTEQKRCGQGAGPRLGRHVRQPRGDRRHRARFWRT